MSHAVMRFLTLGCLVCGVPVVSCAGAAACLVFGLTFGSAALWLRAAGSGQVGSWAVPLGNPDEPDVWQYRLLLGGRPLRAALEQEPLVKNLLFACAPQARRKRPSGNAVFGFWRYGTGPPRWIAAAFVGL